MIQRFQSIWLFIAALFAFISLQISFFSGNILIANVKQFQRFTARDHFMLMILTVLVGATSLLTIFLFKDRKLQLKITIAILLVSLINLILYYQQTNNFIPTDWSYDLSALFSCTIPIFLFMAMKNIYRDEKLVKSADRLR